MQKLSKHDESWTKELQCQSRKPKETEQVHGPVFAAKLYLEKPIDDSMSNRRIHREKIEIDLWQNDNRKNNCTKQCEIWTGPKESEVAA